MSRCGTEHKVANLKAAVKVRIVAEE